MISPLTFVIPALVFPSFLTAAPLLGPGSSGGGGAFVCRSAEGVARSAELLDLWESHNVRARSIRYDDITPVEVQAERAVQRLNLLDTGLARKVSQDLAYVQSHFWDLPPSIGLAPPPDANSGFMKPGCPLEGMLYFDGESGLIARRPEIFAVLQTKTDIAASLTHEALYKSLREIMRGQRDSRLARRLNAELYQVVPRQPQRPPTPSDAVTYRCKSNLLDFDLILKETLTSPHKEIWTVSWRRFLSHEFPGSALSRLEIIETSQPRAPSAWRINFYGNIQLENFDFKEEYSPGYAVEGNIQEIGLWNRPSRFTFPLERAESYVDGSTADQEIADCLRQTPEATKRRKTPRR